MSYIKYTLIIVSLLLIGKLQARNITDMAGRTHEIPEKIDKILTYDAKTSILLFPVAHELLCAKSAIPGAPKFQLINEKYNQLPIVNIKNYEEVLVCSPQIIVAGSFLSKDSYSRFEQLQKKLKIPVILIDLSIDKMDKTYRFIGELINNSKACQKQIDFIENIYRTPRITPSKGTSIYYTLGNSGLITDPSGSKHTEVIDYMNIDNVAKVKIPTGGHANVNMEQVLIWNPDYIFCAGFKGNKSAYENITTSKLWKNIDAVKNEKVYQVPAEPFGWLDHPPSVNRITGILWLNHLLGDTSAKDFKQAVVQFYQLFFLYQLKDAEFENLFK